MRTERKRHAAAPAQQPSKDGRQRRGASARESAAHVVDDELQRYRDKRDFAVTPEPRGHVPRASGDGRFVVQMHGAHQLHYDFRLELDGTLKSWAVPKGPSLDPHDKRLAVHVEDHPIEYASFEGEIPPEQYGAGRVVLWDEGTWEPRGDARADYQAGRLKFELHGHKLRGGWTLVRMGKPDADGKENWLLIKERDDESRTDTEADITAREPRSVTTGRLLKEIGGSDEAVWASDRGPKAAAAPRSRGEPAGAARQSSMPQMLEPQLATLVAAPPSAGDWIYEIKLDGYRMLSRISDGKVRIFTRNGQDWTARLPHIAQALQELPVEQAWLDGEIAAPDEEGKTDFQRLQRALGGRDPGIVYYLFDLLYIDSDSLLTTPLHERKARLAKLLNTTPASPVLQLSEHVQADGPAVFQQACMHGLEGLIGKRRNATYTAGRSRTWIKLKCRLRQEFVIGGYTEPSGGRTGLSALLIGFHGQDGSLHYAGKVGAGFDDQELTELAVHLKPLEQRTSRFVHSPRGPEVRRAHWVQPQLVAEVSFTGQTADGRVRHAVFEGLREDKPADTVMQETAVLTANETAEPAANETAEPAANESAEPAGNESATENMKARHNRPRSSNLEVAGIAISHAGRVIFPSVGATKGDVAKYYSAVGKWILPHLQSRPLALVRCPNGATGQCFFQKHPHDAPPPELDTVDIEESKGVGTYVVANSIEAVVRLVQLGVLELHTWGASVDMLERPDRMILDLDPAPDLPWERVVEGAHLTRALLHELGLESFAKTTGGKGIHVAVPLARRHSWDEVKDFARAVAEHMANVLPAQFTANMSKAQREGRIFVDYLRNARGATAVAAYSTRARPGATVSMPLSWDEVAANMRPDQFTVTNVATRLHQQQVDPWAQYWGLHQSLTAAMKQGIGADPSAAD
jgi:bifunctional non-homologous end joining protein LigD